MSFTENLNTRYAETKSLLCVGLDVDYKKLQDGGFPGSVFDYNKIIIDATHTYALAYKPQIAYYSAYGLEAELQQTISYIQRVSPSTPVILDAKRGDIGTTMEKYAQEAFVHMGADALTVSPYMGADSVNPVLEHTGKGCILLANTSNPSADLQTKSIDGKPLYAHFLDNIIASVHSPKDLAFVVGAKCSESLWYISKHHPDNWILVPGVGAQGGTVNEVLASIHNPDSPKVAISASRSINPICDSAENIYNTARAYAQDILQQMR